MKIKKLITLAAMAVMTGNVWGQTDVTSTYIKNADFSANDALTVHLCGYGADISKSGNKLDGNNAVYGAQEVTEWTNNGIKNSTGSGAGGAGGIFTYGSQPQLKGNSKAAPTANPEKESTGKALGIFAVWQGTIQYTQEVTLPAGSYTLTFTYYNQSGTTSVSTNLFGFETSEKNYYGSTKSFATGAWKTETISFELEVETTGKISVGYKSPNSGSANCPMLFVDNVKLEAITKVDKAKADLNSLIDGITIPTANIGVTFGYTNDAITTITNAVNNAQSVYENSTDLETVKEAITTLTNAKEGLNAENAYVQAEADQHFAFVLTYDGWTYDNKALTYIPNGRKDAGLYTIEYNSEVNANDRQAFTMTKVEGGYKMSQIDADGNERFVCTGVVYGGNTSQIRTTTESDKALVVKVIPTATEGKFNLWNTEANQYLGSQDKGFYTVNSHIDFNIVELAQATLKVVSGVQYGTFIAPFAANAPEDVKLYSVDEVDGTTLKLTEVATIAANTPYIVYADTESTISKTYYSKSTATEDAYQAGLLVGTLAGGEMTLGADCYLLQKNSGVVGFYKCEDGKSYKLGANRAYLKYEAPAGVKAFFFGDENNETAITALSDLMNGKAEIYDLNGRKLQKLEKGVNIVNGKKVIIK